MDLWEVLKASKGVPITSDMYDALFGKALGGAGSVWETDSAPYFFRPSAGYLNSRLLNKEKDTIVGASVKFNQLVQNGNFADTSAWTVSALLLSVSSNEGVFTSATATTQTIIADIPFVSGHKYAFFLTAKSSVNSTLSISSSKSSFGTLAIFDGVSVGTSYSTISKVFSAGNGADGLRIGYKSANALAVSEKLTLKNVYLIDLTQMLGSTIADYAYTLESGTAGAGIAWLKSYGFFGLPYYAYDGGSIKSVSGLVRHEMKDENDNVIGSYPLDSTIELRGLFKMDADHNIYAEGDRYESSGVVTRKYGLQDLGLLNWSGENGNFSYNFAQMKPSATVNEEQILCSKYAQGSAIDDKTIRCNSTYLAVHDTAYSTPAEFNTAMNGVYLIYPLATPTTETAEPFASPQNVDKDGTEEYVTNQNFVPIGHETQYKCEPTP